MYVGSVIGLSFEFFFCCCINDVLWSRRFYDVMVCVLMRRWMIFVLLDFLFWGFFLSMIVGRFLFFGLRRVIWFVE